jgi:hypothetical protein
MRRLVYETFVQRDGAIVTLLLLCFSRIIIIVSQHDCWSMGKDTAKKSTKQVKMA